MGANLVTDILDILFSGLTEAATAIPSALGSAMTNFMTVTTEGVTHLSDAGSIIVVFAGVSIALSLVYLGINVIFSWAHNR